MWVKIGHFRQITGYISKTLKARHIVSLLLKSNRKSHVLYRTVALAMPLSAPQPPQTIQFSAFCTATNSFVTVEPRDFKFGTLTYHFKSHPADEKSSLKGAWSVDFYTLCNISATANVIVTSSFVHESSMWSPSLVMSECSLCGRGQGHVNNICLSD